MTPARPRIGISVNFMHADPERALFRGKTLQYVEERMALAVWRAGGMPITLVDLKDAGALATMIEHTDGLLLTGGADVSPTSYGEPPLRPQWAGDPVRDAYEIRMIELAVAARLPVFGICRGIQLLNVALGGTLWQDIETQVPGALVHRDWHRYDSLGHTLEIRPHSLLAEAYGGAASAEVNSIHHQGLRRVARGLQPTAWAPDGMVEAVESIDDDRWLLGVQWHPEWLEATRVGPGGDAAGRASGARLFDEFLAACRFRAATRPNAAATG